MLGVIPVLVTALVQRQKNECYRGNPLSYSYFKNRKTIWYWCHFSNVKDLKVNVETYISFVCMMIEAYQANFQMFKTIHMGTNEE